MRKNLNVPGLWSREQLAWHCPWHHYTLFLLAAGGLIATACWERSQAVLISEWCQRIVFRSACWPRSKLCHHLRVETGECRSPETVNLLVQLWLQSSPSCVSSSHANMLHIFLLLQNKPELHERHTEHTCWPRLTSGKPNFSWNSFFCPTLGNPSAHFGVLALCYKQPDSIRAGFGVLSKGVPNQRGQRKTLENYHLEQLERLGVPGQREQHQVDTTGWGSVSSVAY